MPGRLIVVYILMIVRALVNGMILVRSVGNEGGVASFQGALATAEFGFALFVLIALFQRKYLAVQVFRPFVIVSACVVVCFQALAAVQNAKAGAAAPYAPLIGGILFLCFLLWFQAYVASPIVRAYLSRSTLVNAPPILPAMASQPNKAPEPTPGAVTPRATEGDSR